jgi:hypothetical protein
MFTDLYPTRDRESLLAGPSRYATLLGRIGKQGFSRLKLLGE